MISMKKITIPITVLCFLVVFTQNLAAKQKNKLSSLNGETVQTDSIIIASTTDEQEIINVAYGTQTKRSVTGAIDVITSDVIGSNSVTNTHHVTQGRFAGLTTTISSGEPGSNGLNFYIRGKGTFGDNAPLILIDGFEGNFAHLSVGEIESISILKDAVATGLYGMRAANGVILVTTKRGTPGKTKFSFSAESGIMSPTELPEFVGSAGYATMVNEALANDGLAPRYSSQDIQNYSNNNDPYSYPNIDWVDEMLRSNSQYHNFSAEATGGNENVRFYAKAGYMYTDGLIDHAETNNNYSTGNSFSRINFRSNVDITLNPNTSLHLSIGGRMEDRNDPQSGVGKIIDNIYESPANRYVMFNEDGSFGGSNRYRNNPMGQVTSKGYDDQHNRTFTSSFKLDQKLDGILKGLSASAEVNYMSYFSIRENFEASFSVAEPGVLISSTGADSLGYIVYGQTQPLKYKERNTDQDHSVNFRGMLQYNKDLNNGSINATLLYQSDDIVYGNSAEPYRYQSVAGKVSYSNNDKYFVDLVAAYNGNNAFNPDKQYGFFPSIGLGWIASEESFLSDSENIDYLKVRASFGVVGNNLLDGYRRFMYLGDYYSKNSNNKDIKYQYGDLNAITALFERDIANPDAQWEKAYQANLGFDMVLYKKLNLTVDLFSERRTDILQSIDNIESDMIGITVPRLNFGEVNNRGVDATFKYSNKFSDSFKLSVDANIGFAQSEIKERYEAANGTYSKIGHPVDQTFGLIADGFYADQNDILNSAENTFFPVQPGDVKYKDISGPNGTPDDKIDNFDITAIGYHGVPEIHYGINIKAEAKGIYASVLFDGNARRSLMLEGNVVYRPLKSGYDNISQFAADNYWTQERGNSAKLPRLSASDNHNNYRESTLYQQDGNFVRLRTAEVGFNFSKRTLGVLGIEAANIYLRGHNLFVIDNVEGLDPEVTSGYPMLKSYNIGLNVKF